MKLDLTLKNILETTEKFLEENPILVTSSPFCKMPPGQEHHWAFN